MELSGTLDATYGAAGRAVIAEGLNGIVVDRAGNVFVGSQTILKYDSAGRADASFVDRASSFARVMAVDASGNVYALQSAGTAPVLSKRDAMGQLVASFGQGGLVDLNAVRTTRSSEDVFVDAAGNVYVQGLWTPPTSAGPVFLFLIKLDSTGRAMTSFGSRGDGTLDLPSGLFFPTARTVDAAGNIVATAPANAGNIALVAFDANGQPAAGFRSGATAVPCATSLDRAPLIERDVSGNVYVGASCAFAADSVERVLVVKLDAAGNPATSFGVAGVAADFVTGGPGSSAIAAMQPAADGGIYVAAFEPLNECGGVVIAKLGLDGKLVDAFGEHGVKRLDLAFPVTMAVDSSGRLYVAGRDRPVCPRLLGTQLTFSVYRLNG